MHMSKRTNLSAGSWRCHADRRELACLAPCQTATFETTSTRSFGMRSKLGIDADDIEGARDANKLKEPTIAVLAKTTGFAHLVVSGNRVGIALVISLAVSTVAPVRLSASLPLVPL